MPNATAKVYVLGKKDCIYCDWDEVTSKVARCVNEVGWGVTVHDEYMGEDVLLPINAICCIQHLTKEV